MSNLKTQIHNVDLKSNIRYRTYHFSLSIIHLINQLPNERVFTILSNQLLRSSTSIGANLIEAKSASSKKDFIKYYEIALKSANETVYWLSLIKDSNLIRLTNISELIAETKEISNMIGSSLLTMKGKR